MLVAFPNVPGPVPKNTLTFPAVRFAETKSSFPSLFRSVSIPFLLRRNEGEFWGRYWVDWVWESVGVSLWLGIRKRGRCALPSGVDGRGGKLLAFWRPMDRAFGT